MKAFLLALLVLGLVGFTGCESTKSLYHWGDYTSLTYLQYSKPDKANAEFQIEKLSEDLAEASAKGLTPPPGFHAHLGYCYLQTGQTEQGVMHLRKEKQLFPESARMIDGMLDNLQGKESL